MKTLEKTIRGYNTAIRQFLIGSNLVGCYKNK
jgi:hypothetical protein